MKIWNRTNNLRLRSAQLIPLGFLGLILVGTLFLMLPAATAPGEDTSILTALFTSVTSVCVTGSVVVDTYLHWSLFGKIIILILIQLGGLGIISTVLLFFLLAGRRITLGGVLLLQDAFNLNSTTGIRRFLKRVYLGTLIVEFVGGLGYLPVFMPQFGVIRGIWYSFFTAVSAFCNAGIDIMGPDSLISYQGMPLVLIVTMILIVMGGLGYVVWFDFSSCWVRIHRRKYNKRYSLRLIKEHTRTVLILTAVLVAGGAFLVFLFEHGNPETLGNMPLGQKILNSIFQSVTFRTAGFSTVAQDQLTETTCLVGDFLMFIGGSPVGTAGGVKTVTIFVLFLNVLAFIRNRNEVVLFGRSIPKDLIRKATAIVTVNFLIAFILGVCLMGVAHTTLTDTMYEILSAVSTVGLSRGLTPLLPPAGKIIVIIAMYLGRIGPIAMLLFFQQKRGKTDSVQHAEGNFIVG